MSCVLGFMHDVLSVVILKNFLDGYESLEAFALSALRIDDYVIHNALRILFAYKNIQLHFNTYDAKVNLL